jgi:hypothetical protein
VRREGLSRKELRAIAGGIRGLDGGQIGTSALYHEPLAATTEAVLAYHALSLWILALLGRRRAFVRLRRTLLRASDPAAICMPPAEPIEAVPPSRRRRRIRVNSRARGSAARRLLEAIGHRATVLPDRVAQPIVSCAGTEPCDPRSGRGDPHRNCQRATTQKGKACPLQTPS